MCGWRGSGAARTTLEMEASRLRVEVNFMMMFWVKGFKLWFSDCWLLEDLLVKYEGILGFIYMFTSWLDVRVSQTYFSPRRIQCWPFLILQVKCYIKCFKALQIRP